MSNSIESNRVYLQSVFGAYISSMDLDLLATQMGTEEQQREFATEYLIDRGFPLDPILQAARGMSVELSERMYRRIQAHAQLARDGNIADLSPEVIKEYALNHVLALRGNSENKTEGTV